MLVEIFESNASEKGYVFNYAPDYYQNMNDFVDDIDSEFEEKRKYLLLYQVTTTDIIEEGAVQGKTYQIQALLAVRSRFLDTDYGYKYSEHIKKCEDFIETNIKTIFSPCSGFRINAWSCVDAVDQYDTNLDGKAITATIEYYE